MVSILAVEADQDVVDLYRRVFCQCQINVCGDSQSGIQYLRQHEPDLVITDYQLPKGSAARMLTFMHLHPQLWKIPVMCVSADPLVRYKAETFALGAVLRKPVDVHRLISTAYKLLIKDRPMPTESLQAALDDYVTAYIFLYARLPDVRWTGLSLIIDKCCFDEVRLRAETNLLFRAAQRNTQPTAIPQYSGLPNPQSVVTQ
jgi:two-component system, OmpR family, phosphate regulon response regulator PhoB